MADSSCFEPETTEKSLQPVSEFVEKEISFSAVQESLIVVAREQVVTEESGLCVFKEEEFLLGQRDSKKVAKIKQLLGEHDRCYDHMFDESKMYDPVWQRDLARSYLLKISDVVMERGGKKRRGRPRQG